MEPLEKRELLSVTVSLSAINPWINENGTDDGNGSSSGMIAVTVSGLQGEGGGTIYFSIEGTATGGEDYGVRKHALSTVSPAMVRTI